MTFLFDEQLSEKLCDLLADVYPSSKHVRIIGLGGAPDAVIWQAARDQGLTIVSKDQDFHRLCLLRGAPPRFIWIGPETHQPGRSPTC